MATPLFSPHHRSKIIHRVHHEGEWHGRKQGNLCTIRITQDRHVTWSIHVREQTFEGQSQTVWDALTAIQHSRDTAYLHPKTNQEDEDHGNTDSTNTD